MKKVLVFAPALALLAGCNELLGIKSGEPIGTTVKCSAVTDCPAAAIPDCGTLSGCEGGECKYDTALDGKPIGLAQQIPGDCTQIVCDGKGATRLEAYDQDAEDDGNPCTQDSCQGGLSVHTPQQQVDCYELPDGTKGPPGTQGMGLCKTGIQLCDANFQPVGACEGAVLPGLETCNTPGDEDCDGQVNEEGEGCYCSPSTTDSCYAGDQAKAGVGVCALGQCLCNGAGTACETACMGWVPPAAAEDCSTPEDDDCDGEDVDPEDGCVCVANSSANCYVCDATGKAYAQVPSVLDDCQIPGDDDCDGMAVDSCTGALGWVKASVQTGSYPSYTYPTGLAVDDAGNVTVVGAMYNPAGNQTLDLGGGILPNPPSSPTLWNVFVARYSPAGAHLWSKLLPCGNNAQSNESYRPRVTVAGSDVVLSFFVGGNTCDFGSGSADSTYGSAVIRLSGATGVFQSKTVVGPNTQAYPYALAGAADGVVFVGGYSDSSGGPFVAKLDAANGVTWTKSFPLPQNYYGYATNAVRALQLLSDGAVGIAGVTEESTIDLGAGPQGSNQSYENQYFAVFEPDGSLRWSTVLSKANGCCSTYWPFALGSSPAGDLRAVGRTSGLSFCGAACQLDTKAEVEPNDQQAQATPLGAGQHSFVGAVAAGLGGDFVAITVPANATLALRTSDTGNLSTCSFDSLVRLYDSGGAQLFQDDNGYGVGPSYACSQLNAPNLAAGTYYALVSSQSGAFSYRLSVTINGSGPVFDTLQGGFYELSFDPATGSPSPITQLPDYSSYLPTSASFDGLGHALVGALQSQWGLGKRNAQGAALWEHPIPFFSAPVVAAGPDGSAFFAGQIYGTQTIDGSGVGTASSYELAWGKLAP